MDNKNLDRLREASKELRLKLVVIDEKMDFIRENAQDVKDESELKKIRNILKN